MEKPIPLMLFIDRIESPIGTILVIHDSEERMRALDFHDYEPRMRRLLKLHYGVEGRDHFLQEAGAPEATRDAIARYFAGEVTAIDSVAVATAGTEFQREVWTALRTIRAGTTTSYGALACRLGRPKSMRAVGLANGANPIGIIVPCHRVIGSDASLTGYGGGLERKRWLLMHEGCVFKGAKPVKVRPAGEAA